MRRGYDRVKGSIGKSYDEIEAVTMSVSRNFHMLSEITTGKKVDKLDCLSIAEDCPDVTQNDCVRCDRYDLNQSSAQHSTSNRF